MKSHCPGFCHRGAKLRYKRERSVSSQAVGSLPAGQAGRQSAVPASSQFPLFLAKHLTLNKKRLPYIIIIILALVLFIVKRCTQNNLPRSRDRTETNNGVNRNRAFDRRVSYIEYTQHARC